MKKKVCYYLLTLGLLFGCSTPLAEREKDAVSSGVYATKDSIDASRYDLAKHYINETTRLVPPPKKRINIPEFLTDQKKVKKQIKGQPVIQGPVRQKYVVLPAGEMMTNIVVESSPEYVVLLSNNQDLAKREKKAQENLITLKTITDKVIQDQAKELQYLRSRPNIFVRTWHFLTGFLKWGTLGFVILAIIALIVAACVPALAPAIFMVFRLVGTFVGMILGLITRLGSWVISLFQKKA